MRTKKSLAITGLLSAILAGGFVSYFALKPKPIDQWLTCLNREIPGPNASYITRLSHWLSRLFPSDYPDPVTDLEGWRQAGLNIPGCQRLLRERMKTCDTIEMKRSIISALGEVGGKDDVPFLVEVLEKEPPLLQQEAASSLSNIGDARALPALEIALNSEDWLVRNNALAALVNLDSANARKYFVKMLNDKDARVKWLAETFDKKYPPAP